MKCLRCEWEWSPRSSAPRYCPACKSARWNVPRKVPTVLLHQKTLQDKLEELPVERQKKIRKKTAEKIAEASLSKKELTENFVGAIEQAFDCRHDGSDQFYSENFGMSPVQDLDLGKEAPFIYDRPMGCGGPSEGPGSQSIISKPKTEWSHDSKTCRIPRCLLCGDKK